MVSYRTAIREAEKRLAIHGKSQLAKLYMLELTRNEGIDLYLEYEQTIEPTLLATYQSGIDRMLNHEPMQYVLGYEWFYGYQFTVNSNVLIPRPETEELVAHVLAHVDECNADHQLTLVDVGCGSGAIAITLKKEEPSLKVYASDISMEALTVAQQNAKQLQADVNFLHGSMLQPLLDQKMLVDVIVCNPPYIPLNERLETTVKEFEPGVALFGGEDGLYFYRMVFDQCMAVLQPNGFMAFEIGYDQKEKLLSEVNRRFPDAKSEVIQDMFGKDRMLFVDFKK